MAMDQPQTTGIEELTGVPSRISWAAIMGGAVMTLATYLVLTLFVSALGLSFTEAGVRSDAVSIGMVILALVIMAGSLFLGGWVTTQLSVGETRREAFIYGVLLWAVVTGLTLLMVGIGIRAGYTALVSGTMVAQQAQSTTGKTWDQMARDAGVPQERIDDARRATDPARINAAANDPAAQERIRQGTLMATWALFGGTLFSIAAAVAGAIAGQGSRYRLFPRSLIIERREFARS